jgi:hypothetical protein
LWEGNLAANKKTRDWNSIVVMARFLALGSVTHACNFLSKALFKGAQASPSCPSDNSGIKIKVSVEHCWNDIGRGKRKNLEEILSQCAFVHHKSSYGLP